MTTARPERARAGDHATGGDRRPRRPGRAAARSLAEAQPARCRDAAQRGDASWGDLRDAARSCRACDLWERATQTVFGAGSQHPSIVLVGEQPGDREDRAGEPFVGPAGHLLDRALSAAGIDRADVYITNVVKHFSWKPRGKWRIHKKPRPDQIRACRPWLEAELAVLRPRVVVALGATAAQALLGKDFRVTEQRGEPLTSPFAACVVATVHPAAVLRSRPEATRQSETARLIDDLRVVAALCNAAPSSRAKRRVRARDASA